MFLYSCLVFVSLFQLLPVAPYRMMALSGPSGDTGLFLGLLTFSSALSAPVTGPLSDRIGHRRTLIAAAACLSLITASYAVITAKGLLLATVVLHGLIWSSLMAASGAYTTALIPAARRAEGLGYWGFAPMLAIGLAPSLGFWVYEHGWTVLCVEIALINVGLTVAAWWLPEEHREGEGVLPEATHPPAAHRRRLGIEWRVMALSVALAMISYGYGTLTSFSAIYADTIDVHPRGLFLGAMAVSVIAGRLAIGRRLDEWGADRVLRVCLIVPVLGLLLLSLAGGRLTTAAAGLTFGSGFGLMFPAFAGYVMHHTPAPRRAAAFGAILAAFDTGIGTGSSVSGWLVNRFGFGPAFVVAAAVAALALPTFVTVKKRLHFDNAAA